MAKAKKRVRTKEEKPLVSPIIIVIIIAAALLVVGGLILLGNQGTTTVEPVDISQFPAKGDPEAPVTIVEYSDYG